MRKCRVAVAFAATFAGAKPESMNGAGDQALDEQIRTFQRTANVESVRRANGLSVHEYALTTLAINMAMMPTNDSEYREYVPRKPGDLMDVAASPEHVKFVQQHLSEIRAGTQGNCNCNTRPRNREATSALHRQPCTGQTQAEVQV